MKTGDRVRTKPLHVLEEMNWHRGSPGTNPSMIAIAEGRNEFILDEVSEQGWWCGSLGHYWNEAWLEPVSISKVKPVKKETNVK